jgi:adenylosuccinate lyase
MAGRSHNVAAQATTLGKRFASAAQETLIALTRIRELLDYPLRGIKGPMGTAQDMLDLLDGDTGRLAELERRIAEFLGFSAVSPASVRCTPARSTTTWSRPWCSWARARRPSRTRSG